ncbi:MAG: DNA-processing protein DprA [Candidatus Edwardsbacteria bacterium]
MKPEELKYWLALDLVPGVGEGKLKALVLRFGSPQAVFRASLQEFSEVPRMDEKTAKAILHSSEDSLKKEVDRQLQLIERHNVKVITFKDNDYPSSLLPIPDAPPILFVRGEILEKDKEAVAVVGCRAATGYGKAIAEKLAVDLAQRGITVVSGMARGIDSAAHRATLRVKGRTIAVLGCGVDIVYPSENRELRDEIISRGAVISEFLMGTEPSAGNFPRRNRLITGLSLGVVAVEARKDSGVFSTVKWALEQGKEVFAVPGPINASTSFGTNQLIKQGAKMVQTVEDILEELKIQKEAAQQVEKVLHLSEEERQIYDLLSASPKHIDLICEESDKPLPQLLTTLLDLELRGVVKQLAGKMFVRM